METTPTIVQTGVSAAGLAGWMLGWAAAVAASAWLTVRLIPWLRRHGAVVTAAADPGDRGMPRGGGLAIVAVVTLSVLAAARGADPETAGRLAAGILPAAVVALVSLADDFRPLPALGRLAVHVAAAATCTVILGPIREFTLPFCGTIHLGAAALPLTVLWIAGITNAFNFMDGIDGIAGIVTAAVAGAMAVAAATQSAPAVAIVATGLSAAACGFLVSNWHPARVFMGDVGSTWCGFLVAVLPLTIPPGEGRTALVHVAAWAAWPFLFDTGWTLLERIGRRRNLLVAHRGHIYQRLVAAGWSHRGVAALYGGLSALAGAAAVAPLLDPVRRPTADAVALAGLCIGGVLLPALASAAAEPERHRAPSP